MSQSSLTPTIEKHFADDLCFASVAQLRVSLGVTGVSKNWWGQIKSFEGEGSFLQLPKKGAISETVPDLIWAAS